MDVRLYDEAAAVRDQSHTEIVDFGETFVIDNWHPDVYEWRDERWQVV